MIPVVPISQRYLCIESVISPQSWEVKWAMPFWGIRKHERFCILSRAFDTLPIGTTFHVLFPRGNPSCAEHKRSVVKRVNIFWKHNIKEIPMGISTLTLLSFPDGVPSLVQNLPLVDHWQQIEWDEMICLSSEATRQAILVEHT